MRICPDCRHELVSDLCARCGWEVERLGAIPVLLARRDKESPLFPPYNQNYDTIAADDLGESIQPRAYLETQARKILGYAGNLAGLDICDLGIGQGHLFDLLLRAGPKRLIGVDI